MHTQLWAMSAAVAPESVVRWLFDTSRFPPRWHCGEWTPLEGWLHIVADLLIWAAYTCIPVALFVFLRKRPNWPLRSLLGLFVAFIWLCGATHFIEAMIFWVPIYRIAGIAKALTAIVSITTVLVLVRKLPFALSLASPEELQREVHTRTEELARSRVAAEEARAVAERAAAAKGDFLRSFHQEARAPVEAVQTHARMLLDPGLSELERRRRVDAILWHCRHELELFEDVLDEGVTTGEHFDVHPVSVSVPGLLHQAIDIVRRGRERGAEDTVEVVVDPALPTELVIDPLRLRQVLVNLLEAATVARRVREDTRAVALHVSVRDNRFQRSWLWISVVAPVLLLSDEERAALFRVGGSSGGERTQLHSGRLQNLGIARRLVEAMGGELLLRDGPAGGAAIEVHIPVGDAGPEEPRWIAERGGIGRGVASPLLPALAAPVQLSALVVDVPSLLAERILEHLQRIGAEVTFVHEVVQVGAVLRRGRALGKTLDVVLLDLDLPNDETLATITLLEDEDFEGIVLPMATYARPMPTSEAFVRLHAAAPLVKPVAAHILYQRLAEAFTNLGPSGARRAEGLALHARAAEFASRRRTEPG